MGHSRVLQRTERGVSVQRSKAHQLGSTQYHGCQHHHGYDTVSIPSFLIFLWIIDAKKCLKQCAEKLFLKIILQIQQKVS